VKNRATAANILGRIPDFRAISIENREIHDGSRYEDRNNCGNLSTHI
jgi:hypothetical protein